MLRFALGQFLLIFPLGYRSCNFCFFVFLNFCWKLHIKITLYDNAANQIPMLMQSRFTNYQSQETILTFWRIAKVIIMPTSRNKNPHTYAHCILDYWLGPPCTAYLFVWVLWHNTHIKWSMLCKASLFLTDRQPRTEEAQIHHWQVPRGLDKLSRVDGVLTAHGPFCSISERLWQGIPSWVTYVRGHVSHWAKLWRTFGF